MRIKVLQDGNARCVYTDAINLRSLGKLAVRRASFCEYDNEKGKWVARLSDGTLIGEFDSRAEALREEVRELENRL